MRLSFGGVRHGGGATFLGHNVEVEVRIAASAGEVVEEEEMAMPSFFTVKCAEDDKNRHGTGESVNICVRFSIRKI